MADRQTRLALTGGQDLRRRNWRDGQHRRGRLGKEAVGLGALGQHSAQDRAHLAKVEANPSTGEGFDQFHQGGVTGFGVGPSPDARQPERSDRIDPDSAPRSCPGRRPPAGPAPTTVTPPNHPPDGSETSQWAAAAAEAGPD